MNAIFGVIITISIVILTFINPNGVLSSMLLGGEKALTLTLKLVVIYAVWLGVFNLLDKTGLSTKFAKILKPVNKFLFGKVPDKANDFISLNVSANILGMSGATTPMGINAIRELDKHKNTDYITAMFFVINAKSIQLIPSSVLALRTSMNSTSPADIILPTILATAVSTIIGVLFVKLFVKRRKNG